MDAGTTKPTATGTATELAPLWGVLGARLPVGSPQDALLSAQTGTKPAVTAVLQMAVKASLECQEGTGMAEAAPLLGARAGLPGWGQISRRSAWKSRSWLKATAKVPNRRSELGDRKKYYNWDIYTTWGSYHYSHQPKHRQMKDSLHKK